MEITLFNSLVVHHLKKSNVKDDLEEIVQLLQQHRLLHHVFQASENEFHDQHQKSVELRDKWLERVQSLIMQQIDSPSRLAGLHLLIQTISAATYEIFHSNYLSWTEALLAILKPNDKSSTAKVSSMALVVAVEIIRVSNNWPDIRRELMKESVFPTVLATFLRHLDETPSQETLITLRILLGTLKSHPRIKSQLPRLTAALLRLLDNPPGLSYSDILDTLVLLPDSPQTWSDLAESAILAGHFSLNRLYVGFDGNNKFAHTGDVHTKLVPKESLPVVLAWNLDQPELVQQRVDAKLHEHRVLVVVKLLCKMVQSATAFPVPITIGNLFSFIDHLLLLDGSILKSKAVVEGIEPVEMLRILPQLHEQGYKLLRTLVVSYSSSSLPRHLLRLISAFINRLKSNMWPYLQQVAELVVEETGRSRNKSCYALHSVRTKIGQYKLIQAICQSFGASSVIFAPAIISCISEDIKVVETGVGSSELQAVEIAGIIANTKKRRRGQAKQSATDAIAAATAGMSADTSQVTLHTPVRIAALLCAHSRALLSRVLESDGFEGLEALYLHCGAVLTEELRSKADRALLANFIALNRLSANHLHGAPVFSIFFESSELRLALYKALLASSLTTSRTQAPVLTYSLQFFTSGLADPSPLVAAFCIHANAACIPIIHPRVPLLPTPIADDQRYNPLSPLSNAVVALDLLPQALDDANEPTDDARAATKAVESGLGVTVPSQKRTKTTDEPEEAPKTPAPVFPPSSNGSSSWGSSVFNSVSTAFGSIGKKATSDKMDVEATPKVAPAPTVKQTQQSLADVDIIDIDAEPDSADEGALSD